METVAIGGLAAFGAAFFALVATGDFVFERHRVYKGLRTIRSIELNPAQVRRVQLAKPAAERLLVPALRQAGRLARRITPASVMERLDRELVHAGSPAGWDAERVVATKILATGAFAFGAFALSRFAGLVAVRTIAVVAVAAVLGSYAPEWVLRARSGRRQESIRRALPDALDLLSITVEAGLGFDAAVDRVATQAGGPLGQEFSRVVKEMQIGTSRADALRRLGDRTSVDELKSFVLAMVQADVFGISIAKVLHVQAAEMRVKRRQRAEEQAQKVPVKIVFPVLFCIFPALFLVVLGPAVQQIYRAFIR